MSTLALPASSSVTLYDFPAHVQVKALDLKREFEEIISSGSPARSRFQALSARHGKSVGRLYALLKSWQEEGDLALVDKREFSRFWDRGEDVTLPREFLEWAGGQMLGNQRKSKPAYRRIIERWREWKQTGNPRIAIPGYATPPPTGSRNHPDGWSYTNLMKQAQPPKAEQVLARVGSAAAAAHLPFLPGTREGVRWLEYVFFDDVWHDRKCKVQGYLDPVRILQLGCLDYASGLYLKFGLRPDLPRDDGTRARLQRRDMLLLVASLLMQHGYPLDYPMHLVLERGTATLSAAEAQMLYDLSGGQIRVGFTSMEGRFVLAWMEGSSGNPRGKGPLESWHNLFHNEQGSLPGQVGKDRDHSPAALYGSDREAVAIAKASLLLPRELRDELDGPYPSLDEALIQTHEVVDKINRRRDHQMEGFRQINLWRIRGTQADFQHPRDLVHLDKALEPHIEWLPVMESPWERGQRLSALTRVAFIPPGALIRFYEDSHFSLKVERRQAKVEITENKRKKTWYFGTDNPEEMLPEGTKITLHFDPQHPEYALVIGPDGLFAGLWTRQIARRDDPEAVARGIRRNQAYLNHTVASVRGKRAEYLAEQERRTSKNVDVLARADLIPESAFDDNASGRTIRNTPVAEGMQRVLEAHKKATDEERGRDRYLRDLRERTASQPMATPSPEEDGGDEFEEHRTSLADFIQ